MSVIIPMFNAENSIERCVESVITEYPDRVEVILIDDGSADGTKEKCISLQDKFKTIKYYHQLNSGVSKARNAGIEHACGKWIMFVDADDYLEKGTIDLCLRAVREDPADMYCFGTTRDYVEGNSLRGRKVVQYPIFDNCENDMTCLDAEDDLKTTLKNDVFDTACGKLFRNDVIKQNAVAFDDVMKYREDSVFVLEYCLHVRKICLMRWAGYHYQIENDETYHFRRNVEIYEIKKLYDAYRALIEKSGKEFEETDRKICSFIFQVLLCGIIHNSAIRFSGSTKKVRNYLEDAVADDCVYACLMKSSSRSRFLSVIIALLRKRMTGTVAVICHWRFKDM